MARSSKKKTERVGQPDAKAALDSGALLKAAQPVLEVLTKDLLARADGSVAVTRALKALHAQEKADELTADTYAVWRRGVVVQIAAAWLLSCVFVRTLEDRGLLASNRIAGEGAADAQHTFDQIAPYLTARDYLLAVFRELERYPATRELFDREHNLAWRLAPSAEAVGKLLELFRSPSAETPAFRFGQADTRFLGDLYQDLSEEVRKRYALLQTPKFVEEFVLDRTLEPAIEEFGLEETTVIDPTCGSGHFLLGGFDRLFGRWCGRGVSKEEAVERALEGVYGVDVNPYAVSIAKFRMTLSALEKLGASKIATAPKLGLNVVVGDSLIEGGFAQLPGTKAAAWGDAFRFVNEEEAKKVLRRSYAAVVGNPPYITVKDKALRERYRGTYVAAAGNYALSAPYMERFFLLARAGGFAGQITSNSFMKREFGKGLVEKVLPREDVQLIVNTAGAYIPGHGTPTMLLFGRHRAPESVEVHTVLARRGEPSTPEDPASGEVWSSIRDHWMEEGFENEYITVERMARSRLSQHPWSLEGGGASELTDLLEQRSVGRLGDVVASIGRTTVVGEDDVWIMPRGGWKRRGFGGLVVDFVVGETVRDWSIQGPEEVIYPYHELGSPAACSLDLVNYTLWPWRVLLENRTVFGKRIRLSDRNWWEHLEHYYKRLQSPLSITFAFVATHNHFVLDRGGKVFKQTAPIIKLPATATEDDHLALLAYLNSSTACFWMKQVFFEKGATSDRGVLQADVDKFRYEFDGTKLRSLPLPSAERLRPLAPLALEILELEARRSEDAYNRILRAEGDVDSVAQRCEALDIELAIARKRACALQEKIDFAVYRAFDLGSAPASESYPPHEIEPEQRAFMVDMHVNESTCPEIARFLATPHGAMLEKPEFKRRWYSSQGKFNAESITTTTLRARAAYEYICSVLENAVRGAEVKRLGDLIRSTKNEYARAQAVDADIDRAESLVAANAIPFTSAYHFTDPGLEKHAVWQQAWALQRREDAGEDVGQIPVPPKYAQSDYRSADFWRLRGKLDVPKERFISYPHCESDRDPQPIYGWAGWDHAQRAKALATLYVDRKDNEAWPAERLQPMLAGLLELLPWVHQWHPEPDPDTGEPFGAFLETWLEGECQRLGFTHDDLRAWRPPKKTAKKKSAKKTSAKKTSAKKADGG